MSDIDMEGVDPVRWAGIRHRIRVIEAFQTKSKRTRDDAERAANELGLSVNQFRRLERVWRAHRQAHLIANSGTYRRQKRIRSDGISPESQKIIQEVIANLGNETAVNEINWEVLSRCELAGAAPPSEKSVWTKVKQNRAENPVSADPTPMIIIGQCLLALPVQSGNGPFRPRAWLALLMPEAVVADVEFSLDPDRQPSLSSLVARLRDASDPLAPPRPIVMNGISMMVAAREIEGLDVRPAKNRQAHVASRLGNLLGGIEIMDQLRTAGAQRHIRSHLDALLTADDAKLAIEQAVRGHNRRLQPGGSPSFRLSVSR